MFNIRNAPDDDPNKTKITVPESKPNSFGVVDKLANRFKFLVTTKEQPPPPIPTGADLMSILG